MVENNVELKNQCIKPEDCLIRDLESKVTGINTEKASNLLWERHQIIHIVENKQTFIYNAGVYLSHATKILRRELYRLFEGFKNKHGRPVINTYTIREILARVCSLSSNRFKCLKSTNR